MFITIAIQMLISPDPDIVYIMRTHCSMKYPHRVLGISKDASPSDIKSAFNRLALKYHPDRKNGSSEKFSEILEAYANIKDGCDDKRDALNIQDFEEHYRGCEEELSEIKRLYERFGGDICKIIDHMIIGKDEDEERIREYVSNWVSSGEVKYYPKFEKKVFENKQRLSLRAKEAEMVEKLAIPEFLPAKDGWASFVQSLEQKYGRTQTKKKKRRY